MELPLMLAGPILRRVEPTLVSVWVALSEPATVRISLWEGRVTGGSANPFIASDPPGTPTLRVGAQLHLAVATIKIPPTSPRLLQPGRLYSYDVAVVTAAATHTLKTLGLLNSAAPGGKRAEALGFEENFLPAFALPPPDLTQLRILFGSCRRPANSHLDAMVFIDDLMRDNGDYESPAREEVLFMRDEMANMAWAIERAIESPLQRAVQRDDLGSPAAPPPALPARPNGMPYHDLSSDVPAHWVPLLPVQVPMAAGRVLTRLKRGAVLVADGSRQVRQAQGESLNTGGDLLLHDEEVPREGARVTRHYELARWLDGSTLLWASRRKRVGRGEGSSGLRYDRIVEPDMPSP